MRSSGRGCAGHAAASPAARQSTPTTFAEPSPGNLSTYYFRWGSSTRSSGLVSVRVDLGSQERRGRSPRPQRPSPVCGPGAVSVIPWKGLHSCSGAGGLRGEEAAVMSRGCTGIRVWLQVVHQGGFQSWGEGESVPRGRRKRTLSVRGRLWRGGACALPEVYMSYTGRIGSRVHAP